MSRLHRSRGEAAIAFLANPYVVLVDVLIATFFVMVLYLHAVRIHNLATTDPAIARIQEFERTLNLDIRRYWGDLLQDEAQSGGGPLKTHESAAALEAQRRWWSALPPSTNVILKQDSSSVKLILFGATEDQALFRPASSNPTQRGEELIGRLVRCLGESRAAHGLAENRAILSITIEGHTGEEGFANPAQSWNVSMQRALLVRDRLETLGRTYDEQYRRLTHTTRSLFVPARFSVVGRGHYLNLPFTDPRSPRNRRVQIEIRFTSRFQDQQ